MSNQRDIDGVADRLREERPRPPSAFVEQLRSALLGGESPSSAEPSRSLAILAAIGTVLLLIVAAGVAGLGPLAA